MFRHFPEAIETESTPSENWPNQATPLANSTKIISEIFDFELAEGDGIPQYTGDVSFNLYFTSETLEFAKNREVALRSTGFLIKDLQPQPALKAEIVGKHVDEGSSVLIRFSVNHLNIQNFPLGVSVNSYINTSTGVSPEIFSSQIVFNRGDPLTKTISMQIPDDKFLNEEKRNLIFHFYRLTEPNSFQAFLFEACCSAFPSRHKSA